MFKKRTFIERVEDLKQKASWRWEDNYYKDSIRGKARPNSKSVKEKKSSIKCS